MLALLALLGADALAVDVPFPRTTSKIYDTFQPPRNLGAGGGGVLFMTGNYVQDKYMTGLASVTSLDLDFEMDDQTNAACAVGVLDFSVLVNNVQVGRFSYVGGMTQGAIQFSESYVFPAINGGGPGGDGYKIRLVADETVCPGGGSYNYFPGGIATLL